MSPWRLGRGLGTLVLVCGLSGARASRGQSIQTMAGGRPAGDGLPATAVTTPFPSGVVADAVGNIYFSDPGRHRVRKVSVAGIITTVVGGGWSSEDDVPGPEVQLADPRGLVIDRTRGELYVAEKGSGRVRRLNLATGLVRTMAGTGLCCGAPGAVGDGGPATAAILHAPVAVALDRAGTLFVVEQYGGRVRRVDAATGLISTVAGVGNPVGATGTASGDGGPATLARLGNPVSLDVAASGDLYLVDIATFDVRARRVRKVDAASRTITSIAGGGSADPADGIPGTSAAFNFTGALALDGANGLLLGAHCCLYDKVWRLDLTSGLATAVAGGGDATGEGVPAPDAAIGVAALALEPSGALLFSDDATHRIRRSSPATRVVTTVAGGGPIGDGGPATAGEIFGARGLAVDPAGNLFVSEYDAARV